MLEVDLSSGRSSAKALPAEIRRAFLGGSGLAAYILMADRSYLNSPLSPESVICIAPGLLTGYAVPAACKASFCARSPQTGLWNESTVGGFFGARLHSIGWHAVVIRGEAPSWSYVVITERGAEIRDASALVGEDTYSTGERVAREVGGKVEVACIGPAGERMLPISAVVIGGRASRLAARGGIGAVFGSKRLKAIAVSGQGRLEPCCVSELQESVKQAMPGILKGTKRLRDFGTAGSMEAKEATGDLPIRNWLDSSWPAAREVCGQRIAEIYSPKLYACFGCPIACGKVFNREVGDPGSHCHGPEYETLAAFGSLCDIRDLGCIVAANDYCNRMGIDTISAGAAVAFAMEAYEKGMLPPGTAPVKWGSGESLLRLLEEMVAQRGLGRVLSGGTKHAAKVFGLPAELSVDSKGLELAMHDPRAFTSQAVSYATNSRGGCHLESMSHQVEGGTRIPEIGLEGPYEPTSLDESKVVLAKRMQDLMAAYNGLGLCKFLLSGGVGAALAAEWTRVVTGWEMDVDELMKTGERLFNLKRMYNIRLGVSSADDRLPERLLKVPRNVRGTWVTLSGFERVLSLYYRLRGWDNKGRLTAQLIRALGLEQFDECCGLEGG